MAQIKSFKEVLEIAVVDDSVKIIKILDKVLDSTTKNIITKAVAIDREIKVIDNQLELELNC